jgi:hypothetical protein
VLQIRFVRRAVVLSIINVIWIAAVLLADGGASIWEQRALGLVTWLLLIGMLWGESRSVRIQVGAVIVAATMLEYTASPLLGLYTYRLENVPSFVPPGHGLVYLAALTINGALIGTRGEQLLPRAVLVVAGAWALWGVTLADRPDVGGALLYLFLAAFILRGRAPVVYAGAFIVTGYLEIVGTGIGNWAWATRDFTGLVSMGNPPSGIAGGYCFLDMVGIFVASRLATAHAPHLPEVTVEPVPEPARA